MRKAAHPRPTEDAHPIQITANSCNKHHIVRYFLLVKAAQLARNSINLLKQIRSYHLVRPAEKSDHISTHLLLPHIFPIQVVVCQANVNQKISTSGIRISLVLISVCLLVLTCGLLSLLLHLSLIQLGESCQTPLHATMILHP